MSDHEFSQREKYDQTPTAVWKSWKLQPGTPYDRGLVELRSSLIARYGSGKDVLDLCCGTGAYSILCGPLVRKLVGLDFSLPMLGRYKENLGPHRPTPVHAVCGDAGRLPLMSESLDFAFAYGSLYAVPNVTGVIHELARILRQGGHAALELGNFSLNTLVCWVDWKDGHGFRNFHIPYGRMLAEFRSSNLEIVEWRAFQILPMHSAPKRLWFLFPLLTPLWKRIMGIKIFGRMVDEWISSSWPLRFLAFRHVFVVRKK